MNNKNITISLFRVSSDSKYLDMIFGCPVEYHFTSLSLEVRFLEDNSMKSVFYDLSKALFYEGTEERKWWDVRLPLDKLGIEVPAIYKAEFKAVLDDESSDDSSDDLNECEEIQPELSDYAVCSDVNFAYRCMLDDILKIDPCEGVSDDAIRKYLLLYGHTAALAAGDDEYAEAYFKIVSQCFDYCNNNRGCCSPCKRPKETSGCNCRR